MFELKIKGSEALTRKLNQAGKKARTARRRGLSKAGAFAVKMFKWFAKPHKDTGATIKSIGMVRLVSKDYVDSIFVGVRKDKVYTYSVSETKAGKRRARLVTTRNQTKLTANVKKEPVLYAGFVEKMYPWYYPGWRKICGKCADILMKETSKAVDDLMKGN